PAPRGTRRMRCAPRRGPRRPPDLPGPWGLWRRCSRSSFSLLAVSVQRPLLPGEMRRALLQERLHRLTQVLARQERRVPRRHVPQSGIDLLFGAHGQYVLDTADHQWRIRRELVGKTTGRGQQLVAVGVDVVDEADLLRAGCVDVLAGQRQLPQVTLADDPAEPLEAADVGHDRNLDLAHAELRVGTGEADVDGRDQVHTATDAPARD